jgi:hypothetical protein
MAIQQDQVFLLVLALPPSKASKAPITISSTSPAIQEFLAVASTENGSRVELIPKTRAQVL